jgi:hypothetical protein
LRVRNERSERSDITRHSIEYPLDFAQIYNLLRTVSLTQSYSFFVLRSIKTMIKAVEASDPEAKVLRIMTTDATTTQEVDTVTVVLTEVVSITEVPTVVPLPIVEDVDMAGADIEQLHSFTTGRLLLYLLESLNRTGYS